MKDIRWLHLSDFHTGKDKYAQIKLFQSLHRHMKEMREAGMVPDMILVTGDVADKGAKAQYAMFTDEFLLPLVDVYEDMPGIYIVPGNHDVDRQQCRLAAGSLYGVPHNNPDFFDTDENGLAARREIFDRFTGFHNSFQGDFSFSVEEMFARKACFCDKKEIRGCKVGIIGVNTAWLSGSDGDKEQLSPGKWPLEEALESVSDCRLKLVLGHHPISWLEPGEKRQISAALARHQAVYLHGHMHKNTADLTLPTEHGFLSLQSGAAFQTRENEVYYNSLYWGICHWESAPETVTVLPRRWSGADGGFVLDTFGNLPEAYRKAGTDQWIFPLRVSIGTGGETVKKKEEIAEAPAGWDLIDETFIRSCKVPDKTDILKYFDGKEPSYNDIFSSYIPGREIVADLQEEFIKYNADNQTKCILLTGAGGEGKTTVFLQVIRGLCAKKGWKALILRQPEKDTLLHEEQLLRYTKTGDWILGVDNCFPIGVKLFRLLKRLKQRKSRHVHLLLCARDTDWINSEADNQPWSEAASFSRHCLRGIREKDAEKIVTAWKELGDEGLGRLKGLSTEEAKERLVQSSRNEERKGVGEGALLGAMLATRYGEELHNHVREMLRRLREMPMEKGRDTLLDAFVYIVAMHSEKLHFLSKPVMAQLYRCKDKDVKKYILGPLGDEAASAVSGDMIYTRHGSIAESARKILDEEFHYDFDEIFIELAEAAVEASQKGVYIERLGDWKFMSNYFVDANNTLAVKIDRKMLDMDRYDPYIIVHLANLYRKLKQPDRALPLFRDVQYVVEHRSFFCEWALAEANAGNRAASICLSAIALSDQAERRPIDIDNAHINLHSIALTFLEQYRLYENETYFTAMAAALLLKGKIGQSKKENRQLSMSEEEAQKWNALRKQEIKLEYCLRQGILTAEADREIDFWEWVPEIAGLEYKKLLMLGGIFK